MPRRMRGGAGPKSRVTESVTENRPPFDRRKIGRGVRVKRRGKSPPPGAQAPGHEKPHAVQDITGSTGRLTRPASAGQLPGISRPLREQGASRKRRERNDHPIRGQPRRDKIRLIATHLGRRPRRRGRLRLFVETRSSQIPGIQPKGARNLVPPSVWIGGVTLAGPRVAPRPPGVAVPLAGITLFPTGGRLFPARVPRFPAEAPRFPTQVARFPAQVPRFPAPIPRFPKPGTLLPAGVCGGWVGGTRCEVHFRGSPGAARLEEDLLAVVPPQPTSRHTPQSSDKSEQSKAQGRPPENSRRKRTSGRKERTLNIEYRTPNLEQGSPHTEAHACPRRPSTGW